MIEHLYRLINVHIEMPYIPHYALSSKQVVVYIYIYLFHVTLILINWRVGF